MPFLDSLFEQVSPPRYRAGELPGESLVGEVLRRASWRLVPRGVLRRFWESVLLGEDGRWCFILGINNSGTTLLHDLLARHPGIRSLPRLDLVTAEGQWHTTALPTEGEHGVPRLFGTLPDAFRRTEEDAPEAAVRALHDWGFRYLGQEGEVLLEKSPPSALRGRWLQSHFRPSRFVVMFRHPCAVAEGVRRRGGCDLRDAARHWAAANELLLGDLPYLDRWTEVRYEELCADPEATLARLAGFLDLPAEFRQEDLIGLNVHSLDESVDTIENFNPRSFERLSSEEMKIVGEETGTIAEQLGYEVPPSGRGEGS